jgi:hypothetical protein
MGCVKYPIQEQAKIEQNNAPHRSYKARLREQASVADARVTYPYSGPKKISGMPCIPTKGKKNRLGQVRMEKARVWSSVVTETE